MTLSARARQALLAIACLLLLGLAWLGISGCVNELPQSETPGQTVQALTQFGYGLFALLSVVTTFWARRWNPLMLGGWTVSATLAGGLAPVVWGGASLLAGFAAAVGSLLVALGIGWLLRVGARGLS